MPATPTPTAFGEMLGACPAMQHVLALIARVAPTDGTVLVSGESGTGKEMVVRAIHRLSHRCAYPLLACDCTALAPTLLESELFGHVKGSFSGAVATKQGLFEVAHRGTMFLDEVANISLEIQGKLLRVLETKRVRKVGDTAEHEVDIRLIAATNGNLAALVKCGAFRADLYYRLNVLPIYLPALRERGGDIPLLANEFLSQACRRIGTAAKSFSRDALQLLCDYPWPGNVRELRNLVERLAILAEGDLVEPATLPAEIRDGTSRIQAVRCACTWAEFKRRKRELEREASRDLEREFLAAALETAHGSICQAARNIGLHRTNLHLLLRRHGLSN